MADDDHRERREVHDDHAQLANHVIEAYADDDIPLQVFEDLMNKARKVLTLEEYEVLEERLLAWTSYTVYPLVKSK